MNKTLLSAMLCVALASGALAGCAEQESTQPEDATEATVAVAQDDTATEAEDNAEDESSDATESSSKEEAAGTESTGNGFAGGIAPMGCCIVPGDKSLEELCSDMDEGLVVTEIQGLHAGLDHVTADFSLQCQGYLVKNGKRDRSVSLITVAGNFLDLMKHVVAVGSDLDWKYRTVAAPSIAFESIAVSGE